MLGAVGCVSQFFAILFQHPRFVAAQKKKKPDRLRNPLVSEPEGQPG